MNDMRRMNPISAITKCRRMYSSQVESSTKSVMNEWRTRAMQERTETFDTITASPLNLLANTLNDDTFFKNTDNVVPEKGTIVPATYHHIYFPPRTPEHKLASDGYETDFHPPYPFDQRMWAGAELTFDSRNPLRVGDEAKMVTQVNRIEQKEGGRLGDSVMVWLDKDIYNQNGWSMREQRCLVYAMSQHKQSAPSSPRSIKMKKIPDFFKTIYPTSILLFRYSGLTFNSHKIHYDQDYARNVEKHPNCLVHGPLSSTLLITALRSYCWQKMRNEDILLESFQYRCLAPLYVDQPFTVLGRHTGLGTFELWINDHDGSLAVKGTAKLDR